jgi:integrase
MLGEGYAVGTVNIKLSTVKTYAKLAFTAGAIAHAEFAMIQTVTGYRAIEGRNVDQTRETTRKGYKKAEHTRLTHEQVKALKTQPDTPQGRRDALLMCLLLDHGLRVSEVADLVVTGFDLKAGMMAFHRRKVNKTQTHRLTPDAKRALAAYVSAGDIPAAGQLLRASGKAKKNQDAPLTHAGMSTRAITKRVAELGAAIGVTPLSAHDCRHAWATRSAKRNPDNPLRLQEAGGWNSLAMPRRYIEAAAIANEGLELE